MKSSLNYGLNNHGFLSILKYSTNSVKALEETGPVLFLSLPPPLRLQYAIQIHSPQ